MNIAIFSRGKFPGLDGSSRRVKLIASGLTANDCKVTQIISYPPGLVICDESFVKKYNYRYIHTIQKNNVEAYSLIKDLFYKIFGTIKTISVFHNLNRKQQIDVILISGLGFIECFTAVFIKFIYHTKICVDKFDINYQFKKRSYLTIRELLSGINISLGDFFLKYFFDIIFTVNRRLFNTYDGHVKGKVKMIAPTLFEQDELSKIQGNSLIISDIESEIKIVCVGVTESYFYGMFPFLKALSTLREKFNFHLIIIGSNDPKYLVSLNSEIKKNSLQNSTTILYSVPSDNILNIYATADILLLAQTNPEIASGGFPFKLAEYLISGTPIITTLFSDLELYCKNDYNCLIVDINNIDEYVIAFKKLFTSTAMRHYLGQNARKTAVSNFDTYQFGKILKTEFITILS